MIKYDLVKFNDKFAIQRTRKHLFGTTLTYLDLKCDTCFWWPVGSEYQKDSLTDDEVLAMSKFKHFIDPNVDIIKRL